MTTPKLRELLASKGGSLLPAPVVDAHRQVALEKGLAIQDAEDWRYTRMPELLDEAFAAEAPQRRFSEEELKPLIPEGVEACRLVFVNGNFRADLSICSGLPEGLVMGSLKLLAERVASGDTQASRLFSEMDQLADAGNRSWSALNGALAGDGLGLLIPEGLRLERPIHVLHMVDAASAPLLVQPRLLVLAGADSHVTLVESHGGPDGTSYFANAVSEFQLAEGAFVEHVNIQRDSSHARRVTGLFARLASRAEFRSHSFTCGGQQIRNEVRVELAGENSLGEINGLSLISGSEHVDNHTWIEHRVADCKSRQMFKSLLGGESTSIFTGRIHVDQQAQRTDAVQAGDALLLSDRARSVARPQLEIYADDVRCTHGSTVGSLDETGMFYMRSRGIPQNLARRILMHAFASDLLGRLACHELAAPLDRLITRTLAES